MKKLFFAFAAGLLLLAGCAKEYDDTALKEKVDAIDKKVTALQAEVDKLKSDVSGISTVVDAWKNADVITKVEEIKEGDKVTGYTLTFKSGKTISLFNGKDGANAPVIGTKKDGDQLYWTVGGEYLIVDGKKVPVNVVPSFELKDGHLWVTIGGVAQDLGAVSEGSSVDGIIKSIVPGEKTVVFTLNGNPETVLEIPLAKPFGFVFEKNDYVVLSADPIVIAYTINGKTEKTDVGILKADLAAVIDAEKITVTPADVTDKGEVVVWASNHIGQADIARLTFGPQEYANTDPAPEDPEGKYDDDVNYIAEATEGAVAAHVTTNVDFTVKPEVDWITVGEITKASYTINFTIADNPQEAIRYGTVKIVLKSNEEVVLQTIKIAQAPGEKKFADGQWVLNTNNVDMQTHVTFTDDESMKGLTNYTYEIRFYANTFAKVSNGNSRRLANISNASEGNNLLLRFGDANDNPGVLVVNGIINNVKTNFRFDALEWNTISITGDGTTAIIYKNGEEIWSGANTGKLDATTFELGMSYADGSNYANSYPAKQVFDGYIDYVRVWNVTRSAAEIKAGLCDVAKDAEGLKAYWVVDGKNKPAGVFADATGHGYDMDFSKTWRAENGSWHDADANNVDVSALVASQWFDFTEPVCPPAPAPDPTYWEVDVLDMAFTGITSGTSYSAWSGKEGSASDAVYAGQSASYNGQCIQLRTNNNNSGIVSTTSGGKLKKIEIKFNQATSDRTIDIYGKNEAYTQATDLYNAATQGTKLGSIQAGTRNYVLYVEGDYQYVGLRSNNGSIYVNEFKISWEPIPQLPDNLQEGLAPAFNQIMYGVTFPEEYASLDNVTMEGWIYPKSFSGAQANLPTFMGTENAFMVRFENSKPQIVLGDPVTGSTGEIKASSATALQTNAWYHIAAVYSRNDKIILYVNGDKVAENNTKDYPVTFNSGAKPGTTDDAAIGRVFWVGNAFSTRWFNGNMSHIRVWKKALAVDEIKASANNKLLMTDPDLIANWPLTDKEGITVTDLSGNELSTKFVTYSTASGIADAENVVRENVTVPDLIDATGLVLSKTALDLMRGDQETLIVSVVPSNALVPTITWESSDANIASVSGGLVTAKGVGEATITAKATVNGEEIKAECAVTVTGLTGAVAPYMKENYFRTMGGYGSLNEVTVEWKMKGKNFDAPTVSSVFGREGQWLLRIGDEGIEKNELQLATNHGNWTTGVKFDTDKWYHVAVTYSTETQNAQIYVNGVKVAENPGFATAAANLTGTTSTTISWNSNPYSSDVNIGASYFDRTGSWNNYKAVNNRWFDGQMCEIRVWSVVRSADEISANMDNLADTSSENLKAYYKMDLTDANNGDGRTIKDYSTAGKDLTCGAEEAIWQQGRENIGNN